MKHLVLASAIIALTASPAAFAADTSAGNPSAGAPANASGRYRTDMPSNQTTAPTKSGSSSMSGNGASTGTSGTSETPNQPDQSTTSSQKMAPGSEPKGTSQ